MSVPSKIVLSMAVAVSTAIIGYVHYKQSADRLKLHEGVIRDIEQQQRRKHENTYSLQKQIDITKQLKTMEQLSSGGTPPAPQQPNSKQQRSQTNLRPIKESTGIQVQIQEGQSVQQLQETPDDNADEIPEAPSHTPDTV